MGLAKEAGSSIFLANEDVRVDLTRPDVTFYIEVRNNKAFVFSTYVRAHAGLPLGSQGRVLAYVNDDRSLLSAWLMMKRGCKAIIRGTYGTDVLSAFDPSLKIIGDEKDLYQRDILGYVLGTSVGDLKSVNISEYSVPLYFPTIGMSDSEVSKMLNSIRTSM
jgi:thiamine biosynthesis protein ThiI